MSLRTFFTGWKSPLHHRRLLSGARQMGSAKGHRRRLRVELLEDRAMLSYLFDDSGDGLALAPNGDVFVSGRFRGWVDFDPTPTGEYWLQGNSFDESVDSYGWGAPYLARYSPSNQLIWARTIPDAVPLSEISVSSYADAGVTYLYNGWYSKTTGQYVVGKFGEDGSLLWQKNLPAYPSASAVDPSGGLYMVGGFNGANLDFDPSDGPDPTPGTGDTLTSNGDDIFVLKWDTDGNFAWVRQIGGPGNQGSGLLNNLGPVIAADASGVYVGGEFAGTVVPPGSGESYSDEGAAGMDGLLIRLGLDGSYALGDTGHFVDAVPKSLGLGDGAIFVAGSARAGQDVDPGPGTLTLSTIDGDFFVRIASPTSSPVPAAGGWAYAHMWGGSIAYADGALYMTRGFGDFGGTFDFDPDPNAVYNMTTVGNQDIYVYKVIAADGDFVWAKQFGGSNSSSNADEIGFKIAVSSDGVYSTGMFISRDADFDPNPAPTATKYLNGDKDRQGYVSKLDTSGNYQWAFSLGAETRTIDNGDVDSVADADTVSDYQELGGGWKDYRSGGYQQDGRYHAKGSGSGIARWTFSGLALNHDYDVYVTYRPDAKNATNAPFKVNGSAAVLIDQRVAPNSFSKSSDGTNWRTLGRYTTTTSGNLVVELNDKANGNVVADAVFVIPAAPAGGAASSSFNDQAILSLLFDDSTSGTSSSRKK